MDSTVRIEDGPFDPSVELAELVRAAAGRGAVVSFVGLTRGRSHDNAEIDHLVLEHHPSLTIRSLQQIAEEVGNRFGVSHVRVVHRSGRLAPNEAIVFAGAASSHRRAAFEAADYLMDRLKTDAVFWKREEGAAGANWIEPTETDYADRSRWE